VTAEKYGNEINRGRHYPDKAKLLLWVMSAVVLLYVVANLQPVIYDETEGQYSGAAKEMLQRGDWLIPSNNGIPRFQKPPLVYWMMMSSMSVFGINEFAARLPNAIFTIGWIFATYLVGQHVLGPKGGIYSAITLASSAGFFVFCHLIMPEPFLAFFITMTIWCFFEAKAAPDHAGRWFRLAWIFMALACLTKGAHGAVYPLGAAFLCACFDKASRPFWKGLFFSFDGISCFFVLYVPWYLAVEHQYPGFIKDHFINEQLGHGLNKRWPPTCNQVALGTFIIQHFFFLMPMALLLPVAARAWCEGKNSEAARRIRHLEPDRFSKILLGGWFAITFLTASVSARQDYYTMSAWSAAAIWLGWAWITPHRYSRFFYFIPCIVLIIAGVLGLAGAQMILHMTSGKEIIAIPIEERDHLWTAIQGFSLSAWKTFLPMITSTSASLLIGGLMAAWLTWKRRRGAAGLVVAAAMAVPLLMAAQGFSAQENYFSLAYSAKKINLVAHKDAIVVYNGEPNLASSLFFYLNRRVHWVEARPNADFAPRTLGIGRELYFTPETFAQQWKSERQVFLIIEESLLGRWAELLSLTENQKKPVHQSGTRIVIANHL